MIVPEELVSGSSSYTEMIPVVASIRTPVTLFLYSVNSKYLCFRAVGQRDFKTDE